jgi:hypothetical protein
MDMVSEVLGIPTASLSDPGEVKKAFKKKML